LEVTNWSVHHPLHPERLAVKNVDFHVRRGEVVGIAGLMGAGRTEFAMSLFGRSWGCDISGRIRLDGRQIELPNVAAAIDAGLAYVTEDRKQLGLILADDVRKNVTLASLAQVAPRMVIDDIAELKAASDYRNRMRIRCSDVYQETGQLSGGNQQKVVLSKWLMTDPKVLILDEPTRGIDVGAKYEIYCIINELAEAGRGIVVISSEMPELLGICDRICVMNDGAFVGEFAAREATQEKIMRAIMRNDRNFRTGVPVGAEMGGLQP
jgi:putative multiple sugar transport system ATP-binding protein